MRTRCLQDVSLWCVLTFCVLLSGLAQMPVRAQQPDPELRHSIEQLRHSVGRWHVMTRFLKPDGSIAKEVSGSYEFAEVVPDRVVSGRSDIPELQQTAAILFYINEAKRQIEMVSVGRDGKLWVMTGPLGQEQRLSQEFANTSGGTGRLRFTRFNVSEDAFESKMEYTDDGGKSWKPGNHQRFRRVSAAPR